MKYLLTAAAFIGLLAPSAQAEDILSIIERRSQVEQPKPPLLNPYNYTLDVVMSAKDGQKEGKDEKPPFTAKLLIDPSAAPEARVTIISKSSEDHPKEFKEFLTEAQNSEKSREEFSEDFWCESGDDNVFGGTENPADSFTVLSETASEAVIKPNLALMAQIMMDEGDDEDMSKSERKMMKKMMERLDGEFVVSKPDARLKHLKIWLTRPMTVAVVAKIKEMEVTQSCAIAPNGFSYTDNMKMRVKVKALGMGIEQNMDIKISGLTLR